MGILDQFSLAGKRALVTGGTRGLGRAMAIGLAEAGASVCTVGRTDTGDADGLLGLVADVGDLDRLSETVDQVEDRLGGPVELVLHAAGVQHRSPAVDFPVEEWDRLIRVHLTAPFLLSREVGRRQIAADTPGSHLFVASLTSELGLPNLVAYSAAKSGVMGVVRSLSSEWSSHGVRVNAVGPGYFRTTLTEALFQNEAEVARLSARIPMRRFGDPADLAGAAVYLMSNASAYVTGQLLYVDGGWTSA